MSHFIAGKLNLKCSVEVLRRALSHIMPEWAEHIKVDPDGRIPIYTYTGQKKTDETFHIVVPGIGNPNYSGAPGMKYSDLGLKRTEDGSWEVQVDRSGMPKFSNIEDHLSGEVARMKAKAVAKARGYQVVKDESNEEETTTWIKVPSRKAKELMS